MNTLRMYGLVFLIAPALYGQTPSTDITAAEIQAHVKYLASDELEGRGSGTVGNQKAAKYIVEQFSSYGLKPAGTTGSYLQEFEFISEVKLGTKNSLSLQFPNGKTQLLTVDKDFRPLGFSSAGSVSGELVFAGYGIAAPEKNYDDYEKIDAKGKIVIALRYGPDGNDIHSDLYRYTSLRNKARYAREHGAAALIIVDAASDELVKLSYDQSFASSGIPCVTLRPSYLEQLVAFSPERGSLDEIREHIKTTRKPVAFELAKARVSMETEVVKVTDKTANVLAYLEGSDPVLKDEVLVIGAHFDHLGYGGEGSGSLVPDSREIHNGADDNASGTAALLELAQKFSALKPSLTRSILFAAFSGEEMGTLGSQHYVNNSSFALDKTIAMVNMDEVGRLRENVLTVYGTGTSPSWNPLLTKLNVSSTSDTFSLKRVPEGFGPSDHAQFYAKDIPVLFFFTGTHSDYHKPSDDWDKVNYSGEEKIVHFIYEIADAIQKDRTKPQFTKAQSTASMGGGDGRGFSVTLGIVPDYGESEEGLKIGGTRPGGPAEKAGLKAGDIITKLAGKKVLNIYDYMGILGELKAGDVVDVEVVRDAKPLAFTVTMQKR